MSLPVQRLAGVQISLSLNVWKCSLANYIVNHLVVNNNIIYYVSIGGVCGWRLIEAGSTSLSWTLGLGEAAFLVCIDKSVGTGNTNPTILFSLPKKNWVCPNTWYRKMQYAKKYQDVVKHAVAFCSMQASGMSKLYAYCVQQYLLCKGSCSTY